MTLVSWTPSWVWKNKAEVVMHLIPWILKTLFKCKIYLEKCLHHIPRHIWCICPKCAAPWIFTEQTHLCKQHSGEETEQCRTPGAVRLRIFLILTCNWGVVWVPCHPARAGLPSLFEGEIKVMSESFEEAWPRLQFSQLLFSNLWSQYHFTLLKIIKDVSSVWVVSINIYWVRTSSRKIYL